MKTRIARHLAIYPSIALIGYGIGACRQNVMLDPSEDDLLVLNDCVVSACNYLAAVKTQHALEKNFWAKTLLVRYVNHRGCLLRRIFRGGCLGAQSNKQTLKNRKQVSNVEQT